MSIIHLMGALVTALVYAPKQSEPIFKGAPKRNSATITVQENSYWKFSYRLDEYAQFDNWYNNAVPTHNYFTIFTYYSPFTNSVVQYFSSASDTTGINNPNFDYFLDYYVEYAPASQDFLVGFIDTFYKSSNSVQQYRTFLANNTYSGSYYIDFDNLADCEIGNVYWDSEYESFEHGYFTDTGGIPASTFKNELYSLSLTSIFFLNESSSESSVWLSYMPLGNVTFYTYMNLDSFEVFAESNYYVQFSLPSYIIGLEEGTPDQWYQVGYLQGYDDGWKDGVINRTEYYEDMIPEAYQNGYSDGYAEGQVQDETASVIFTGIINVALIPINFFLACFNFEVFGINIGNFIASLLTLAIVVIIVRLIVGSKND